MWTVYIHTNILCSWSNGSNWLPSNQELHVGAWYWHLFTFVRMYMAQLWVIDIQDIVTKFHKTFWPQVGGRTGIDHDVFIFNSIFKYLNNAKKKHIQHSEKKVPSHDDNALMIKEILNDKNLLSTFKKNHNFKKVVHYFKK